MLVANGSTCERNVQVCVSSAVGRSVWDLCLSLFLFSDLGRTKDMDDVYLESGWDTI